MQFKKYVKEAEFAIAYVRQAARMAKQIQEETCGAAFTKEDKSPVTIADFAVQALVAGKLFQEFPKDLLVGEEDSSALRTPEGKPILEQVRTRLKQILSQEVSAEQVCEWIDHGKATTGKRFWTMDPIDGTKGFVRGDQFAVALALIEDGDIKVGVLGCPNLTEASKLDIKGPGTLLVAVRGEGAWQQPLKDAAASWKQLHTSNCETPHDAVLLRSYEKSHQVPSRVEPLMKDLGVKKGPLQMDSLAKYAVLASGTADLMLRFPTEKHSHEYIWDQAAGQIAIEEAGGRVTDLDGKALDYTQGRRLTANRGVILSNSRLHAQVLAAVKKIQIE
jgi:3'(2'), 5'-bisphosphate nucleotidase